MHRSAPPERTPREVVLACFSHAGVLILPSAQIVRAYLRAFLALDASGVIEGLLASVQAAEGDELLHGRGAA